MRIVSACFCERLHKQLMLSPAGIVHESVQSIIDSRCAERLKPQGVTPVVLGSVCPFRSSDAPRPLPHRHPTIGWIMETAGLPGRGGKAPDDRSQPGHPAIAASVLRTSRHRRHMICPKYCRCPRWKLRAGSKRRDAGPYAFSKRCARYVDSSRALEMIDS